MSQRQVELLSQLKIVVIRQASAHESDIVVADCDGFKFSSVQMLAD